MSDWPLSFLVVVRRTMIIRRECATNAKPTNAAQVMLGAELRSAVALSSVSRVVCFAANCDRCAIVQPQPVETFIRHPRRSAGTKGCDVLRPVLTGHMMHVKMLDPAWRSNPEHMNFNVSGGPALPCAVWPSRCTFTVGCVSTINEDTL